MLVAPVPVILLIVVFELGKFAGFAMVLFCIDTIRLIFLTAPCMVVIVFFVVIAASGLLILGAQGGEGAGAGEKRRDNRLFSPRSHLCDGGCNFVSLGDKRRREYDDDRIDAVIFQQVLECR